MSSLLELSGIRREYSSGVGVFAALEDVSLKIDVGEYVAIVGASGSGKSTLMNILGCLDRPTSGTFRVAGRNTAELTPDELAELRRQRFGFIFQRYNLLPDLTALANVEVPGIYAGQGAKSRRERAAALLDRLKLGDRLHHLPGQLSGGQQQRVGIARALMNGGEILLADEPTGALDSEAGEEVLTILKRLHDQAHTLIVVTHDWGLAQHAQRIIELRDGEVIADHQKASRQPHGRSQKGARSTALPAIHSAQGAAPWDRSLESLQGAFIALCAHRLRTALTMLGIVIGIASVVAAVALGAGSEQRVLQTISALGTNTISIYPGGGSGDIRAERVQTLRATDALQLAALPFVDSATPGVSTSVTIRYGPVASHARVSGVGDQYFRVQGTRLIQGTLFDTKSIERADQSVILDENARDQIFGVASKRAIGAVILVGRVPARIIGVVESPADMFLSTDLRVWVPYTTLMTRILGQSYVSNIIVRVSDNTPVRMAEERITRVLSRFHGRKDFFLQDTTHIGDTIEAATRTMTWLVGSIAAISLLVGGIGVMNVMLISVTDRTREIGVRIAVGARQADILRQFLSEAVLVCLIGGTFGVLLALALGALSRGIPNGNFPMIFSTYSIIVAFSCSTLVGIGFGLFPARSAAQLDPVEALARD